MSKERTVRGRGELERGKGEKPNEDEKRYELMRL